MKRREGKRSIFFVEEEKRESNDSFKEERMIISLIIITGNDFIITILYQRKYLALIWSTYILISIKPDVFTVIIALFFTKPLLNHFFMTSLFSMTILIRNLTIPK